MCTSSVKCDVSQQPSKLRCLHPSEHLYAANAGCERCTRNGDSRKGTRWYWCTECVWGHHRHACCVVPLCVCVSFLVPRSSAIYTRNLPTGLGRMTVFRAPRRGPQHLLRFVLHTLDIAFKFQQGQTANIPGRNPLYCNITHGMSYGALLENSIGTICFRFFNISLLFIF